MTDAREIYDPGDDITISGTIKEVSSNALLVAIKCRDGVTRRHWVNPAEINTYTPHGNGGKAWT